MQADREYSTDKGRAHAAYDGSTWHVTAHPIEGDAQQDALTVEAYRDEAGFRGRQWRVEGLAASAVSGHNPIGMGDQFPTLKAIAEAAIHEAQSRVELHEVYEASQATAYGQREAARRFSMSSHEGVTVDLVDDGGPNADGPWVAFAGIGEPKPQAGVQRLAKDCWSVYGWNPDPGEGMSHTYLHSTHVTAGEAVDAALVLVARPTIPGLTEAEFDTPAYCETHQQMAFDCPCNTSPSGTVDLTPGNAEQGNILTMLAQQFARQGMEPDAYGAMASVLDLARCLQANDPERLDRIIEGLMQDEKDYGPDR